MSLALWDHAHAQSQLARFTNVNYTIYPQPSTFTVPLLEVGNIRWGPLRVHPHFGTALTYTDNVFRVPDSLQQDLKSDWYVSLAPGAQVQLPFARRHLFVFDYRSNIERYVSQTSQDIADQTLAGNLLLNFPWGLSVRSIGELKNGHDYRGTSTANPQTQSAAPNQFYAPNWGIEAEYAKDLYIRAQYKYLDWQFIGPQAGPSNATGPGDISTRNRIENYYGLATGGRIAPKTNVYLQGLIAKHVYQFNTALDSTTYNLGAGVSWEVTGKTAGQLSIGWQKKAFDQPSQGRGTGNFSSLAFRGSAFWAPQPRTAVNLAVWRSSEETTLGGTRFFVSTGLGLQATHSFTYKWRATARFNYNHVYWSDPITTVEKTATRRDDNFDVGAGLWYQIQPWLGTRVAYTYSKRISNFESVAFDANVVMLSIQAQF